MPVQYLFVYGTLLKGSENMMSNYLKSKSTFLQEALMPGRLYKVDFYPGAVYEPEESGMVLGELYQLNEPEKVLEVLDTYEGYYADDPDHSLFVREEVNVFAGDEQYACWAYLYHLPTEALTLIESGDFLLFEVETHA